jgi:predicted amidohydrolase
MIKEQEDFQVKMLKELSKTYTITIVAPMVIVKKDKIYKCVVKFAPNSTSYYQQQLLINYPHWNEKKYFSNDNKELKPPLVFTIDGFRFAVMNGFEIHFDEMFESLKDKNIDCLLLPSVSTFDSYERWKSLILSRAFTHNIYVLRANRIGEYDDKEISWNFYGDSLLASPNGELLEHLGNKEELMIVDMSHSEVVQAKRVWGFKDNIQNFNNFNCSIIIFYDIITFLSHKGLS